jgi:hypothetical protein
VSAPETRKQVGRGWAWAFSVRMSCEGRPDLDAHPVLCAGEDVAAAGLPAEMGGLRSSDKNVSFCKH